MSTTLLIVQLIISIILTGLILIQRSEGGALGIGGGGGGGGFMSGRAAGNSIARMTGILGTLFIVNSLALTVVYGLETKDVDIRDTSDEVEALTPGVDSPDTTIPLADDVPAADTPAEMDDPAPETTDPDE